MSTERFQAEVQYGDWRGTSAADSADKKDAENWLEENGNKEKNEFLIGIRMFAGENHGAHKDPVFVEFLLASPRDHDTIKDMINSSKDPIPVRRVKVDMTITQFLGLFKRFSVAFSSHGMLDKHEYTYPE